MFTHNIVTQYVYDNLQMYVHTHICNMHFLSVWGCAPASRISVIICGYVTTAAAIAKHLQHVTVCGIENTALRFSWMWMVGNGRV